MQDISILFEASPMNMGGIFLLLVATTIAGVIGWFYSGRTRRLVVFTLVILGGVVLIAALIVYIRLVWFPTPYL